MNNKDDSLNEISLDLPPHLVQRLEALCRRFGDDYIADIMQMVIAKIEAQFTIRGALPDKDTK
jgi:hypothetical protein